MANNLLFCGAEFVEDFLDREPVAHGNVELH